MKYCPASSHLSSSQASRTSSKKKFLSLVSKSQPEEQPLRKSMVCLPVTYSQQQVQPLWQSQVRVPAVRSQSVRAFSPAPQMIIKETVRAIPVNFVYNQQENRKAPLGVHTERVPVILRKPEIIMNQMHQRRIQQPQLTLLSKPNFTPAKIPIRSEIKQIVKENIQPPTKIKFALPEKPVYPSNQVLNPERKQCKTPKGCICDKIRSFIEEEKMRKNVYPLESRTNLKLQH